MLEISCRCPDFSFCQRKVTLDDYYIKIWISINHNICHYTRVIEKGKKRRDRLDAKRSMKMEARGMTLFLKEYYRKLIFNCKFSSAELLCFHKIVEKKTHLKRKEKLSKRKTSIVAKAIQIKHWNLKKQVIISFRPYFAMKISVMPKKCINLPLTMNLICFHGNLVILPNVN